jgi:hypothetical protein
VAAGAIAVAAIAAPTTADARGGRIAAGIIGGLAAGAIIGGAVGAPYYGYGGPYYGGGPYYAYVPGYYDDGPGCYWHRERFFDGYGWRVRRVQVCR